ncbi:MAG: hypothetical protein M0Q99_05480 [Candidatus Cloacimonetes bacterium]|nr:hypothetical protein [Candidatus Cloacimonadota bacterium]
MSDTSLMISIFAVIIAFTSLIWNIIKQIMNDRHVLKINAFGGFVAGAGASLKVVYIDVINASKFPKYNYEPMFCVSKSRFSKQTNYAINYNYRESSSSPVELTPGKKTSYYVEVSEDLLKVVRDDYDHSYVQFKVKDSLGRTYRSKKMKTNELIRA